MLGPCYRGTAVEHAAERLPYAVEWHPGSRLSVADLRHHGHYRGQAFVDPGAEIAHGGWLTSRVIGDAAHAGRYASQDLKKVWHCLARFEREQASPDSGNSAPEPQRIRAQVIPHAEAAEPDTGTGRHPRAPTNPTTMSGMPGRRLKVISRGYRAHWNQEYHLHACRT